MPGTREVDSVGAVVSGENESAPGGGVGPTGKPGTAGGAARAVADLRALAARFGAIVERSLDAILVLDREGTVLFANPSTRDLFGRPADEIVGGEFGFPAVVGDTTEIDVVRPGGDVAEAEMRAADTTWDGEDALLVLIRDITHRKSAERQERELLLEQHARAKAEAEAHRAEVMDGANRRFSSTLDLDELLGHLASVLAVEFVALCVVDVADHSGAIRRLVAARADDSDPIVLRGRDRPTMLVRPEILESRGFSVESAELVTDVTAGWVDEASADWAQLCRVVEPTSLMRIRMRAGDQDWGSVTVYAGHGAERFGRTDLGMASEIVRRAAIAAENARLFRLAQEASRAKSNFLAVVSHELRTPLSGVLGYASVLSDELVGELNDEQKKHLESIVQITRHLARLIEQLLVFARIDRGEGALSRDETEAVRVAGEVATLVGALAQQKALSLRVLAPDEPVPMITDEKKLSQILINLVTNAIKYTREGEVRLEIEPDGDDVLFRVVDTGVGIEEDWLEEIFLPFHQLEDPRTREFGGTGIGLSLVKDLAELLGGGVSVSSEVGRGSTFTVRVPRVLPEES